VYITYGFANPHGHAFDHWGQDIVVDGTGSQPYHAALFSGFLPFPQKHAHPPQVYQQRTRPCPGIEVLSSKHFPDDFQGNLLVGNVIGFQGILRYKIEDKGASFVGTEQEPILSSTDPNFRPSDLKIGPDGALYFLDWHNPIIGHMQHNLRDPSRDRTHGRIYRVTYEGRPLLTSPKIAGEPLAKLLEVLKAPEDRVRYRARVELTARQTEDVIPALKAWLAGLDTRDRDYEHNRLEGLWAFQSHNVVNADLLRAVLASPDFHARAAAVRVLCYWRDRVPDALDLLLKAAADAHPRVRLEAVRAASFFASPEALEVVLVANEKPTDVYLDFTRGETRKVLDPLWKKAVDDGKQIAVKTDAGARYLLRTVSLDRLLKMDATRPVMTELLFRAGVPDEQRRKAARGLAKLDGKPEPRVLLDALAKIDAREEDRDESIIFDLVRLLTTGRSPAELSAVRADLEGLALKARQPVIRQIGFVALVNVDGGTDRAWALAEKSVPSLLDMVNAVPLIADAGARAGLYAKVEPLLAGLPKHLAGPASEAKVVRGRYVRVELPGRQKTLTLAEVEVFSDGHNVARQGKASQKNTAHGGDAGRAIDGNKSGTYGDGGQTHSQENTTDPWWEVDLGSEVPIESIAIYNRTDGSLGKRLDGFTLKVLDRGRTVVFEKTMQPAPAASVTYQVGREPPEHAVRRAAMLALTSVRGQEARTFQTLAKFIKDDVDREAAVRAVQRLPHSTWPKEDAGALFDVLLAAIKKLPPAERTSSAALEALELADALTAFLPPDQARKARTELGEIGVRVVRVGTLPERMAYDKDVIAVKAGKPFEILFENFDLMPHNLVILQPGALEEIGLAAEATATDPDAAARQYVPRSAKVLLKSNLLQPRETQKLSFVAPKEPGVYPIVCTYPGHWRRMYAALYVVADLDAYQAAPEEYLKTSKIVAKDALLADRRPRTEWKLEDLAPALAEMKGGRSFGNGKEMFKVAACISCHKIDGQGNEFGPDLLKLDAKIAPPVETLRHILEPSLKIDDKYLVWTFVLKSGKTATGMVLEETPEAYKVIENPLAKAEPRVIKKDNVEKREKSPVSLMPKGLLDKLSRDEVLDLIAYIAAKGDKDHPLFKADGHHGH
jgi:putative heme-binding domain-containing protein